MISVIIPTLDEGKLLPECLNSFKKQDYKGRYEIILVDNGSTDDTKEIAEKFGIKIIYCLEKGVFHARKMGVAVASGDIIVQADADTVYTQDWLTKISKQFSYHPEIVAVAGKFFYKDPPYWAGVEYFLRNLINNLTIFFLGKPLLISGANFSFRKNAFFKIGGYNKDSLSFDQYDIANRLSKLGIIIYDKGLYALTSSRRVQKPLLFVSVDFISNLASICSYFFKSFFWSFGKYIKVSSMRTAIKISPFIAIIVFCVYGYFIPSSQVFGKVYYKEKSPEKIIALTFDDGPNEPYTSEVLNVLDKYNVKATFFVIGKNVEIYSDTVKRILADGDVIGDHSYSHDANHALTDEGCEDINIAQQTIFKAAGVEPHLYRPPHGKKSPWELSCLKKQGLIEIEWSDETNELHSEMFFGKPSAVLIAEDIIENARPGKIILLHDGYGTLHNTQQADKSLTVEALPIIIEKLQAEGYRFVTVPELLNVAAYNN